MKTRAWVWHIVRTRNIFYSIFLRNFYALTWNVVHGESLRSKLESWQQKITYFFLSPFRLSQKEKEWQIFALQKEWMNKIQKGEYAGTSVACIYDTFFVTGSIEFSSMQESASTFSLWFIVWRNCQFTGGKYITSWFSSFCLQCILLSLQNAFRENWISPDLLCHLPCLIIFCAVHSFIL